MRDMYIIPEIWNYIKTFIFHNIKVQGKHLKKNTEIKQYNNILKNIPRIGIPSNNIRIIRGFEFIKYVYFLPTLNNWKGDWKKSRNVIEHILYNEPIEEIRNFYYYNHSFHKVTENT